MFKMSQLTPAFKFKVGMDFKSIAEFKMAIRGWNVLNGYQIKFVKNDKDRCIKTLGGDHKCGRVLENSSANANWLTNEASKEGA